MEGENKRVDMPEGGRGGSDEGASALREKSDRINLGAGVTDDLATRMAERVYQLITEIRQPVEHMTYEQAFSVLAHAMQLWLEAPKHQPATRADETLIKAWERLRGAELYNVEPRPRPEQDIYEPVIENILEILNRVLRLTEDISAWTEGFNRAGR